MESTSVIKKQVILSFLRAAQTNDVQKIREYLYANPNFRINFLSAADRTGKNALHLASECNGVQVVGLLVQRKIQVNICDMHGRTALHYAAIAGYFDVAVSLVEFGANMNILDNNGMSAVAWSAKNGYINIAQYLTQQGADFQLPDAQKRAPLMHAAMCGHLDVVRCLSDCSSDNNVSDDIGMTTLSLAAQLGHTDIVKYLLAKDIDIDKQDSRDMTSLQIAADAGQWDAVKYLISAGADLNICDADGVTILERVVQAERWPLATYLIREGANLSNQSSRINNVMNILIEKEKWDIFNNLVATGTGIETLAHEQKLKFLFQIVGNRTKENVDLHKSFYSVIRLGNIELLEMLIAEFGFNDISQSPVLEKTLAKAYEELRLKYVILPPHMKMAVEAKLIDLRFFSDTKKNVALHMPPEEAKLCVEMIQDFVREIEQKYSKGNGREADQELVYKLEVIARNIHILKRVLKSTYTSLPWEEIEFCLLIYVTSVLKSPFVDETLIFVMDKDTTINHLINFSNSLMQLKSQLGEDIKSKSENISVRVDVIKNIIEKYPEFQTLYRDYEIIRNIYSLKRIDTYIQIAISCNLNENVEVGKLAIQRALQVIGETLNNSPDSPKVSKDVQRLLLNSAPKYTMNIVTKLRDSLSHTRTLTGKIEIEVQENSDFFKGIQNDLRKIGNTTNRIFSKIKIDALKLLLEKIIKSNDTAEVTHLGTSMAHFLINTPNVVEYSTNELAKIKEILLKTKNKHEQENNAEIDEILNEIADICSKHSKNSDINAQYLQLVQIACSTVPLLDTFANIKTRATVFLKILRVRETELKAVFSKLTEYFLKNVKYHAEHSFLRELQETVSVSSYVAGEIQGNQEIKYNLTEQQNAETENDVTKEIEKIFIKIDFKLQSSQDKISLRNEIKTRKRIFEAKKRLINFFDCNIHGNGCVLDESRIKQLFSDLDINSKTFRDLISWYETKDFKKCLEAIQKVDDKYATFIENMSKFTFFSFGKYIIYIKNFFSAMKGMKKQLDKALNDIEEEKSQQIKSYYKNKLNMLKQLSAHDGNLFDAAMEMILLDSMEILKECSLLEENHFFLYDRSPLLARRSLRNYLAHGDPLSDASPFAPSRAIRIYAQELILKGDEFLSQQHGVKTQNISVNFSEIRRKYQEDESLIADQIQMFQSARNGNLQNVLNCIGNGADIKSADLQASTVLLHSAASNNVDLVKLFLAQDISCKMCDVLYSAVTHGSLFVVKYLTEQYKLDARWMRFRDDPVLLVACGKGHRNVAKYILNRGRDANAAGNNGFTPLHASTITGEDYTAELLLQHGANIETKTEKGATPLHVAAMYKHRNIVQLLLKHGAEVNSRNTANNTPLHSAAYGGDGFITADLLRCGATIDALVLHIAVIQEHSDVVTAVLVHGAELQKGYLDNSLLNAAIHGQDAVVSMLLDRDANVNTKDEDNGTALHAAARGGHAKVVQTLLSYGSQIDARTKSEEITALHVSAMLANSQVASLLIDGGADLEAKSHDGKTALLFAASGTDTALVKMMINKGANVNATDDNGSSPLHLATITGCKETVIELINGGAIVDCRNHEKKRTPLHVATKHGCVAIMEVLVSSGADVNSRDESSLTPLHIAASTGRRQAVGFLLKQGPEINAVSFNNLTALHVAVISGYKEVVEELLANNCDVNIPNTHKRTPLLTAAIRGSFDIVIAFFISGENAAVQKTEGATAFEKATAVDLQTFLSGVLKYVKDMYTGMNLASGSHNSTGVSEKLEECSNSSLLQIAAYCGDVDFVNILLDKKVDVNARTDGGDTALHLAAMNGHSAVCLALLRHGADLRAENNDRYTALHLAAGCGNPGVAKILLEHANQWKKTKANSKDVPTGGSADQSEEEDYVNARNNNGSSPLHFAAHHGQHDVALLLLQHGADVNAENESDETALCCAALQGHGNIVSLLLDYHCDVNHRVRVGYTPLHLGVIKGSNEVIKILLERKADINSRGPLGSTPLHHAIIKGFKDVAKCLIQNGADIEAKDISGATALHIAAFYGRNDIVTLLLNSNCDANTQTNKGETALKLAEERNYSDIVNTLLEHIFPHYVVEE